jgi:hypothetical protein
VIFSWHWGSDADSLACPLPEWVNSATDPNLCITGFLYGAFIPVRAFDDFFKVPPCLNGYESALIITS